MYHRDHYSSVQDVRQPMDGHQRDADELGLQLQAWQDAWRIPRAADRFGSHAPQIEADVLRNFAKFSR